MRGPKLSPQRWRLVSVVSSLPPTRGGHSSRPEQRPAHGLGGDAVLAPSRARVGGPASAATVLDGQRSAPAASLLTLRCSATSPGVGRSLLARASRRGRGRSGRGRPAGRARSRCRVGGRRRQCLYAGRRCRVDPQKCRRESLPRLSPVLRCCPVVSPASMLRPRARHWNSALGSLRTVATTQPARRPAGWGGSRGVIAWPPGKAPTSRDRGTPGTLGASRGERAFVCRTAVLGCRTAGSTPSAVLPTPRARPSATLNRVQRTTH